MVHIDQIRELAFQATEADQLPIAAVLFALCGAIDDGSVYQLMVLTTEHAILQLARSKDSQKPARPPYKHSEN